MSSARLNWMMAQVSLAFNCELDDVRVFFDKYRSSFTRFLEAGEDVPAHLFVFYQPLDASKLVSSSKGGDDDGDDGSVLALQLAPGQKLVKKCVYFLRTTGEAAVKQTVASDPSVICGEVTANILQDYESTLQEVYFPALRESEDNWGRLQADGDKRKFLRSTERYLDGLSRRIKNLHGDLELQMPPERFGQVEAKPTEYARQARDPSAVRRHLGVLTSWCEQVSEYIRRDPSSEPLSEDNDEGPDVEIDYWGRRRLTLISVTEQLKTNPAKVVEGVLRHCASASSEEAAAAAASSGDLHIDGERIKDALERWHEVNMSITDASNEAKDNVRFLSHLQQVLEPIYSEAPDAISDCMPAIMNSMKMIHTLSRHYGTEVRMTNLFMRIANQLITRCKAHIYGSATASPQALWTHPAGEVIERMSSSIRLFDTFTEQYEATKKALAAMQNGKQFNFDPMRIFHKSTLFCRRLEKLIDMFSSKQQFKALEDKHIDGMEKLIESFNNLIDNFKLKAHALLDYTVTAFERDFVEYTMHNSGLENAIQEFMGRALSQMSSIDEQLELLAKFRDVLHRDALQEDLEHRYLQIFKRYGEHLNHILQLYDRHRHDPPAARNMPPIAGNINWSRQLLRRITSPMSKFQQNPKVFQKENKKIIHKYNRLARLLIEYESIWFQAWQAGADSAKRGLRSPLIVAEVDPEVAAAHQQQVKANRASAGADADGNAAASGRQMDIDEVILGATLHVNFDHDVLELIREARHLQLMGFTIPPSAKTVLLLEDKLKTYYNKIKHAIAMYNRIVAAVPNELSELMRPHLRSLARTIRPAMTTMTWTSMNIEGFLTTLTAELERFDFLVSQVVDVVANRINNNLHFVSRLLMLNVPSEQTFTLRDFSAQQRRHIEECTNVLDNKNREIERAVHDVIDAVQAYRSDGSSAAPSGDGDAEVVNRVLAFYCDRFYDSLLGAMGGSLRSLRDRATAANRSDAPLFDVDLSLVVPEVSFNPPLADVQETLDSVTQDVIGTGDRLLDWGVAGAAEAHPFTTREPKSFYSRLGKDDQLADVRAELGGTVDVLSVSAAEHLKRFDVYSWLWNDDPEEQYANFVARRRPLLHDVLNELHKFVTWEERIDAIEPVLTLGSLAMRAENLKQQFKHEVERWKFQYSEKLHQEVKSDMEELTDQMKDVKMKLEREVKDFASLKFVMDAQAELREVQSSIDVRFISISERYQMLERYLPFGVMGKDEMDAKSILRTEWASILAKADEVMENVNTLQAPYKQDLLEKVEAFQIAKDKFLAEYEAEGPMVPGTAPQDAMTALNKFKREFESLDRKRELYNGGERLFGLPERSYPELARVRGELKLLKSLYDLYHKVITHMEAYKEIPWAQVVANIDAMNEQVDGFNTQCRRLSRKLHEWPAYKELSKTINDFLEILPLLTDLSKPAMRPRHWEQISQITGYTFDLAKFSELKLRSVLDANLLEHREDIEEIADGAVKQLGIEKKIHDIEHFWNQQEFELAGWSGQEDVILMGACVAEVMEQLEESQAALMQMLTMRHVAPFREHADGWLTKLSDVNETLEGWVKVQMLWMSLQAVFTGGDIARNLPQDTRVFLKVDKEWTQRLMGKAKMEKNVIECCTNEYIKTMLPTMMVDLEKCQKALDGYLETKRAKFPRFYFVSNKALLLILSQGSDKEAVQGSFSKIFDSIDRVEFKGNNITKIITQKAGNGGVMDSEEIELTRPVAATGFIEDWLAQLLTEMRASIKSEVRKGSTECEALPLKEFLDRNCAQVSLLGIQFLWTADVDDALSSKTGKGSAMKHRVEKQKGVLDELLGMTLQRIPTKMLRTKIETLVTIQVHQVDVLRDLKQRFDDGDLKDVYDFEWQKQLRCSWHVDESNKKNENCMVKIADVDFTYCYEYLGCKERLVITPLTDRCYITLSQAIGMYFGGAPAGPAGTGKTETVKDLGRALGKLVVVFNCSDQMHTADTAKIYKGLCQAGAWGCFDEFNRIDLEVLSVVAQQVMAVLNAMRGGVETFTFPGQDVGDVQLDPECGFFITMNPGYAGRQELPENLKALFRGVAMMVPDREIIIKVKLASVGYQSFERLSKKFRVLYGLCEEQLSKQRHYDFGLRNILSVLRTAGVNLRRELEPGPSGEPRKQTDDLEEMLMMRTLRDMNLSKLVAEDVTLFRSLLADLFPNQENPQPQEYPEEQNAMKRVIEERGLINHKSWVDKCTQLYETSLVRHGLMMVGPAGGGKSTAIEVLVAALSQVGASPTKHQMVRMNPKAITAEQMFGENDLISGEWTPGIFSKLWEKYNDVTRSRAWIVCDGPVDAIWIENLNTVLDDNKVLTLANGERMDMTDNVRLLFEVQDLRNASPATVSRAGIIYVSSSNLGYHPLIDAWLRKRHRDQRSTLLNLFTRYIEQIELSDSLDAGSAGKGRRGSTSGTQEPVETEVEDITPANTFKWMLNETHNVIPVEDAHLVTNLLSLLDGLLLDLGDDGDVDKDALERLFLYALCWSLGGLLEQADRERFHAYLTSLAPASQLPPCGDGETIYDYFVSPETFEWRKWEPTEWVYPKEGFQFSTCLVPTVDSVRAEFVIDTLLSRVGRPVLLCGSSGTAKTSIVLQYTLRFDPAQMLLKKVNFSSATTHNMFQMSIESDIDRQGKTYGPTGGRSMTVFLDDLSMPEVNKWGDQPTLEIVRQLIEDGGFYTLDKDTRGLFMIVEKLRFVAAMSHPGGGRNDIPGRLKRHFFCFNMTPPSQASIDNIYGSMLRGRYAARKDLLEVAPVLTTATIELWTQVKKKMLPTPAKFHYIFNMRDLSRVFQGILHAPNDVLPESDTLIDVWRHECTRVFCDKLVSHEDKGWFEGALMGVLKEKFGAEQATRQAALPEPVYMVDFLRDELRDPDSDELIADAPKIYERADMKGGIAALRKRVTGFLDEYNEQGGHVKQMQLVLFTDALQHLMRIARIIGMPRGNALLVGVGGSGRQSLTRLAAYIAGHETFQIKLARGYKVNDFLEDIRGLYVKVGKEGKKVTWVFTDFEIIYEDFLEYVNGILATGEVPGLFTKEDRDMMCADLRGPAKRDIPGFEDTPDNLYKYFLDRIRDNLHIVLCFSPANEKFAERARRFPGLISGCTIDWFLRWPAEALADVSKTFVQQDEAFTLECDEAVKSRVVRHIANVHDLITTKCEEYFAKFRRAVYVTPKSYLSFIKAYKKLYSEKLADISRQERNVNMGLEKLRHAEKDVAKMQILLEKQNEELAVADQEATAMLAKLEVGAKEAEEQQKKASVIEEKCAAQAAQIEAEKQEANAELEQAMPFVREAESAAKSVKKKDITVIATMGTPPDLIKLIMDCVLILNHRPLEGVSNTTIETKRDEPQQFITDSYDSYAKKMMASSGFTTMLLEFADTEKDKINEETMELLEPYLNIDGFSPERAKKVSGSAEGLCKWVKAMAAYHVASLIVGPKLEQLQIKSDMYAVAEAKLNEAKAASQAAQDEVDRLKEEFSATMAKKTALERKAKATQDKMRAANDLIKSLAGEKVRWGEDAKVFAARRTRLVGDCALACAFVSYCGPFNHEYRREIMANTLLTDAMDVNIPVSRDLEVNSFLVDAGTIAEWNSQGLPKDDLSIQNGILVTQASRFPLLIDPQGQALAWLVKREANNFPAFGTTTAGNPNLRKQLEFCLDEGKPLLVEGIVNDVDPMLDPVLERNTTKKGRKEYIMLGGEDVLFSENFRLYLITKLPNPRFSPELSAKTTIIDFSVTQKGLEDQLLSRVIQNEQQTLEDKRQKLVEEVNMNTIALQRLDKQLLDRLSESKGDLLEDIELIGVLADTKTKAKEVQEKIKLSKEAEELINAKRENYRPVATRGSVLYFVIVDTANINVMYQTSLAQFLKWFDRTMEDAEPGERGSVAKRVANLIEHLTFNVYENISRGVFEKDKLTYKLMTTLQILTTEQPDRLRPEWVPLLLRGGADLTDAPPRNVPDWLAGAPDAWANLHALATNIDFFRDIRNTISQDDKQWQAWFEQEAPEAEHMPSIEERLDSHRSGAFFRLLLIRALRNDRTRLAANEFIGKELGERYTQPVQTNFERIHDDANNATPVILLLTPGADPTSTLEELAKKKGVSIDAVSLGEGQRPFAERLIDRMMEHGGWALLQNCHLGLGFMADLEEHLARCHEERDVAPEFRLWITCEPHKDFPISLLQMSVKVTNEPPAGLKAGLLRSYSTLVHDERLQRVDDEDWKSLIYGLCFLHSVVQERRAFTSEGTSLGWNITYEFNQSDLEASLTFLERHFFAKGGGGRGGSSVSWDTVRYMVCEAQYGGRITDDRDRRLFNTFGDIWLGDELLEDPEFEFRETNVDFKYMLPRCETAAEYREFINQFPNHDTPEIFGLHPNADLTLGTSQANLTLGTISNISPQDLSAGDGMSKEEVVYQRAEQLLAEVPEPFDLNKVRDRIVRRPEAELKRALGKKKLDPADKKGGMAIPLNVHLAQEIDRMQSVILNVRGTLQDMRLAIEGAIIMTPELQRALDAVSEGRVPEQWYLDASGAMIAWVSPTLAVWIESFKARHHQLHSWCFEGRPNVFWLANFANPSGALTSLRQEITRRHNTQAEASGKPQWALDDVVPITYVEKFDNPAKVKGHPAEGIYVCGLFLQGCSWSKQDEVLQESAPKELFTPMPVLNVTAVTKSKAREYLTKGKTQYYECPVYERPRRNDLTYIFSVPLPCPPDKGPDHWTLRGVALLGSRE